MRVAIDAGGLLTEKRGAGRAVRTLIPGLARFANLELTLITDEDRLEEFQQRYGHLGIDVDTARAARTDTFDIVWYPWGRITFPTPSPRAVTLHHFEALTHAERGIGTDSAVPHTFLTPWRTRIGLQRVARQADLLLAHTSWSKHRISEALDIAERDIAVVTPVPTSMWNPVHEPLSNTLLAEMPYVLIVGGWRSHHRLAEGVRTFRRAFHREEVRLILSGSTYQDSLFTSLPHHLALQPSDTELRELYRHASAILILASESHHSWVVSEATACGGIVLAGDVTSLPESMGESGLILPPDDWGLWSETLREVVNNEPLRHSLRQSAIAQAKRHSPQQYIDEMAAALQRFA